MINVIIPTVGLGSRMGNFTKNLNKALLPYTGKPVLSHIIEQFPIDTHFIIPVGYLSAQIIDFCKVAYPDRNITIVHVDDWTSKKAGTAYTLKCCREYITGPFWYVPCDTFFDEEVLNRIDDNDCYFIKNVGAAETENYTTFDINDNKITNIFFKERTVAGPAYTGLAFIHNYERFFSMLSSSDSVEFIDVIMPGSLVCSLDTWLDFGNSDIYELAVRETQSFDFSKPEEITYICNNKVVKWWLNPTVAEKKYAKILANPAVYPDNCRYRNNWLVYDFFPGTTLYKHNNPDSFSNLLDWLDKKVWIKTERDISKYSAEFYKTKSLARIKQFREKYPILPNINYVDGVKIDETIIDRIDWEYLSNTNLNGLMHGDLQFDNIIVNKEGQFILIDWRHEFSGLVDSGDIYYDLAKMWGGLIINYSEIKNNNFKIDISEDRVTLDIPNIEYIEQYQNLLKKYILENSLDYKKVQLLVPVIFLNMSPLHVAPFDLFLWYLGIKLLHESIL